MSKSLPVYDLSQWIKSDRNIGYVVARMGVANVWEVREDYKGRKDVERFNGRGAGYVIQWVDLRVALGDGPHLGVSHPNEIGDGWSPDVIGSVPRRLSWLRDETIAEKRYQPCENPVKVPAEATKAEEPVFAPIGWAGSYGERWPTVELPSLHDVHRDSTAQIELEQAICAEDAQPVLPLDVEPRWCGGAEQVVEAMAKADDAAVDIMRTVVAAGKKAEDWLIANGLTP